MDNKCIDGDFFVYTHKGNTTLAYKTLNGVKNTYVISSVNIDADITKLLNKTIIEPTKSQCTVSLDKLIQKNDVNRLKYKFKSFKQKYQLIITELEFIIQKCKQNKTNKTKKQIIQFAKFDETYKTYKKKKNELIESANTLFPDAVEDLEQFKRVFDEQIETLFLEYFNCNNIRK
jgi:hypothetical protein